MTHNDIYTKFMIEYDKANVTSSYPSLTEYEVATVLDKAYNALIAQKVTGNNVRRAGFESDVKAISDINPLLKRKILFLGASGTNTKNNNIFTKINDFTYDSYNFGDDTNFLYTGDVRSMPDNMRSVQIPNDMLYFVAGALPVDMHTFSGWMNELEFGQNNIIQPMDNKNLDYTNNEYKSIRLDPIKLVNHKIAEQFYATSYNIPWVKNPVCFLEDGRLYLLCDPIIGIPDLEYYDEYSNQRMKGEWMSLTYVRKPNLFVKDLEKIKNQLSDNFDSDDTQVTWQINDDVFLNITIDRYNMSKINDNLSFKASNAKVGDRKIHINGIYVYYPYRQNAVTEVAMFNSLPNTCVSIYENDDNTYHIECGISNYNIRNITIDGMKNLTQEIGSKHPICSNDDDSVSLSAGSKLIVCCAPILTSWPSINENILGQASKLIVIKYSDLYNVLRQQGKISSSDDAWSSKVSYNPNNNTFSNKISEDPIKITSSHKYNDSNNTYTGYSPVYSNDYELYYDLECTDRPEGTPSSIFIKFKNGFTPNDSYDNGNVPSGRLVIDTVTEDYIQIEYSYGEDGAAYTYVGDSGSSSSGIAPGTVLELINNSIADELSGKTFSFGTSSLDGYILDTSNYTNSSYTYMNIFNEIAARDEQAISSEEYLESLEFSYFKYRCVDNTIDMSDVDSLVIDGKTIKDMYTFELDDVVAGELITLAVSYALENVESPRLNNHLQMRGFEA